MTVASRLTGNYLLSLTWLMVTMNKIVINPDNLYPSTIFHINRAHSWTIPAWCVRHIYNHLLNNRATRSNGRLRCSNYSNSRINRTCHAEIINQLELDFDFIKPRKRSEFQQQTETNKQTTRRGALDRSRPIGPLVVNVYWFSDSKKTPTALPESATRSYGKWMRVRRQYFFLEYGDSTDRPWNVDYLRQAWMRGLSAGFEVVRIIDKCRDHRAWQPSRMMMMMMRVSGIGMPEQTARRHWLICSIGKADVHALC